MAIEFNCNPVVGEVTVTQQEQEIIIPKVFRIIISVDGPRVQVSFNDNLNYVTYHYADGKTEVFNSSGIDKMFVKSDGYTQDDLNIRFWGYR